MGVRLRLTRCRTVGTRIIRVRGSGDTPRNEQPLMVEGTLCVKLLEGADPPSQAVHAGTVDDGVDYDHSVVLELDQAADDGRPRLWVSAPLKLIIIGSDGTPLRIETADSEYLLLLL